MIPTRFVTEYPERCMQMLEMIESRAREMELVGSFSLMVASSIFLIPYERMKKRHPLDDAIDEPELYQAIKQIQRQKFLESEVWDLTPPGDWRMSRIITKANPTHSWRDENGCHPMAKGADNTIVDRTLEDVLRVIRNALAHGNVVYLDRYGRDHPGKKVEFLAFLSRYEESEEQRAISETYRLVATTEECFLSFVKVWARWLTKFPPDDRLFAAAAE